jgi:hypothetical protein
MMKQERAMPHMNLKGEWYDEEQEPEMHGQCASAPADLVASFLKRLAEPKARVQVHTPNPLGDDTSGHDPRVILEAFTRLTDLAYAPDGKEFRSMFFEAVAIDGSPLNVYAAAPGMLAVLERIRDSYPGYIPDFIEAVNAVITKAQVPAMNCLSCEPGERCKGYCKP